MKKTNKIKTRINTAHKNKGTGIIAPVPFLRLPEMGSN